MDADTKDLLREYLLHPSLDGSKERKEKRYKFFEIVLEDEIEISVFPDQKTRGIIDHRGVIMRLGNLRWFDLIELKKIEGYMVRNIRDTDNTNRPHWSREGNYVTAQFIQPKKKSGDNKK